LKNKKGIIPNNLYINPKINNKKDAISALSGTIKFHLANPMKRNSLIPNP